MCLGYHLVEVVLVDGCGVLHPQGFGSACHLGVSTDTPTVGVSKTWLNVEGLDRGKVREELLSSGKALDLQGESMAKVYYTQQKHHPEKHF